MLSAYIAGIRKERTEEGDKGKKGRKGGGTEKREGKVTACTLICK